MDGPSTGNLDKEFKQLSQAKVANLSPFTTHKELSPDIMKRSSKPSPILIIDDEQMNIEVLQAMLNAQGY